MKEEELKYFIRLEFVGWVAAFIITILDGAIWEMPAWAYAGMALVIGTSFLGFFFDKVERDNHALIVGFFSLPLLFAWIYMFFATVLAANELVSCLSDTEELRGVVYLYFSYTTYTTLGYGDLHPQGVCRVVAMTQSMVGYIFLAYLASLFVRKVG